MKLLHLISLLSAAISIAAYRYDNDIYARDADSYNEIEELLAREAELDFGFESIRARAVELAKVSVSTPSCFPSCDVVTNDLSSDLPVLVRMTIPAQVPTENASISFARTTVILANPATAIHPKLQKRQPESTQVAPLGFKKR